MDPAATEEKGENPRAARRAARKAQRELGHGHSPIRPAVERQLAWLRERNLLPESGFGLREFFERFFPSSGQLGRMGPA